MKKFLCFLLMLPIFANLTALSVEPADELTVGVTIGNYFSFGSYNGNAILWRCVDIDDNGVLLLSDKAITNKAFDGNGSSGSHARGAMRNYGSNYWADSNIRSWLNSDKDAGDVVWLCGNPPSNNNVTENPYDNEAGFLNGFTENEKSLIKQVTQKSILDQYEYSDMSSYGTAPHIRNTDITTIVQNYDTAYGESVTDKIFLLDVKQLYSVYENFGKDYCIARGTNNQECRSWLRTARATLANSCNVRAVTTSGSVENFTSNLGEVGVRPAFYLDESALINSGSGTASSPYTLVVPSVTNGTIAFSATLPKQDESKTVWVISTVRNRSGVLVSVNMNSVNLSDEQETPVSLSVSNTDFIAGYNFDIFVWDTDLSPIIDASHYKFAYVDAMPTLLSVSD